MGGGGQKSQPRHLQREQCARKNLATQNDSHELFVASALKAGSHGAPSGKRRMPGGYSTAAAAAGGGGGGGALSPGTGMSLSTGRPSSSRVAPAMKRESDSSESWSSSSSRSAYAADALLALHAGAAASCAWASFNA